MSKITPAQLRKIYALSKERGIDNDTLHAIVYKLTKKDNKGANDSRSHQSDRQSARNQKDDRG